MNGDGFLTLRHGQIPADLLPESTEDTPVASPAAATGWWVVGVDWNETDETPYVLDGEEAAPLHEARRHLDQIVGRVAQGMLGVDHDIVVVDWVPVSGLTAGQQMKPVLHHVRHTLTIATTNNRSRTWWGLPGWTVDNVLSKVEAFDAAEADEEPPFTARPTVVTLDVPVTEDGDVEPLGGAIQYKRVTIRLAMVVEVVHDVRIQPLTDAETLAVLTKHDPGRKQR